MEKIFGSKPIMERIFRQEQSRRNGFIEYCGASRLSASDASGSWNLMHRNAQQRWGKQAVGEKKGKDEELETKKEEVLRYPGTGPCGSRKKKYLVSRTEVRDWLSDERTGLRESWKKKNIGQIKRKYDVAPPKFKPAEETREYYKMLLFQEIPVGNAWVCRVLNSLCYPPQTSTK